MCESSDDFGEHDLPEIAPQAVAILDAGAYGYTMASRYNGRALPAEIFIQNGSIAGIQERCSRDEWVRDRLKIADEAIANTIPTSPDIGGMQ